MAFLYNFGFSQEDERTQAAAIQAENGNILCIAGAGDLPLSLLAMGARKIIALDISEPQLHLCRLKSAAILGLQREDAAKFLGFMPSKPAERKRWLAQCIPLLSSETADFWNAHAAKLCSRGAILCGRYEQFLDKLRILLRPVLGKAFNSLTRCSERRSQIDIFEKRINRPWLRGIFRLAFDPRVFSGRGMDPKSLMHRESAIPLGLQYWAVFRAFCTNTPASANPWLQLSTLGRLASLDAAPAYLTPEGFETSKRAMNFLSWVKGDMLAFVNNPMPEEINKVCLSNLPDWMDAGRFEALLRSLACKLESGSLLVWCYLHAHRIVSAELSRQIILNEEFGAHLRDKDRFPFYHVVPAQIR
jgi:S-adenosylmethionine-diacylglycerol 3-amino-3-carboxypropyl transferase